jgi:pimeloyl-ACP methyl ester carboxylesterase
MKLRSNGKVQGSRMQQRMQLSGGRTLVFDEYGTTDGFPIVYMHGTPGSRKEWLLFGTDNMVGMARVRLIVPDRPGIGLSQIQPGRMITDWADDIRQLADHLRITRFSVLGISGGCSYALVCAASMPERVVSVGIVSGIGPHNVPGLSGTHGLALGFQSARRSCARIFVAGRSRHRRHTCYGTLSRRSNSARTTEFF